MSGRVLVALLLLSACKGKSEQAPAPKPMPAPVPPPALDLSAAKPVFTCALEALGHDAIYAPDELSEVAPAPVVRLAAEVAIERARADGPASQVEALVYEADMLRRIDDVDGLRAVLSRIADDVQEQSHLGPQRARAGLAPTAREIAEDRFTVAREMGLAGDRAGAMKVLEGASDVDRRNASSLPLEMGALAATGQTARARKMIADHAGSYRVQLAGAWLETALRARRPIDEPLAVLIAEARKATDDQLYLFQIGPLLGRGRQLGRDRDLRPIVDALRPRLAALVPHRGSRTDALELAIATGDVAAVLAASKGLPADLPQRVEVARAPLDRAFAVASTKPFEGAMLQVLGRWAAESRDPALGAKLSAALCAPPRPPATAPIGELTAEQVDRPKQTECEPHDVVLSLSADAKLRARVTLKGDCVGACTAKQKRQGAAEKAKIDAEVAAGTADPAEANYSFTGCSFTGFDLVGVQSTDEREVAILTEHFQVAHDVDATRFRVAFESCGDIFVSDPFGVSNGLPMDAPDPQASVEKGVVIIRDVRDNRAETMLKIALPACPGAPSVLK